MTRSNLGPSQVGAGKDFAGHDAAISKGKDSFINNTTVNNIGGKQVSEKQSLSKALRPKADD
jgi:hypothetical protein